MVPVEEYLKMSFDGPAAEYLDGEIKERFFGWTPHFKAQERMLEFFRSLKESNSIFAYPEVTVEIVSEDDRYVDIKEKKLASYRAWGVKHVWLVDPWRRELSVYDNSGLHEVPAFELPEFGASLSTTEIFID